MNRKKLGQKSGQNISVPLQWATRPNTNSVVEPPLKSVSQSVHTLYGPNAF